ncbi:Zn-dependent exopeptidase [Mollisia scopiformis]|uniref:Zn-dependent exopeptidase n=1 Tax=Mollisia scopiformis TaxID=149040 RepID=A0A132B9K7_MOLSC|nr:Zn-dependent exopeptidase [Mollisia scopiformis]KUJ09088.1 Zn-dependent exopeptidase [Mollisia scopiformis]
MKNLIALSLLLAQWVVSSSAASQQPLHDAALSSTSSLLELHKSLVEIPSISGSERNVSTFLIKYLESKNFTVKSQPVSETRENVLAYIGPSPKAMVLVTSHIDTVPPFWPYERKEDEIWGRAVESRLQSSEIAEGDVGLLFVVGEEKGGEGMKKVNDLRLSWESVIFGEPTELKLASGHKGGMGFTMKAKGKAGHSGYPELGKSATLMLVRALAALDGLDLPSSEKYGNTTVNIGRIEGGVAENVITEDASAIVSIKVAAGSPAEIKEVVEKAIYKSCPDIELAFTLGTGPISIDHDIDGFETAVMNYGTYISSLKGNHKRYLYGPGTILVAHSDHEHLSISDLEEAVEGYKTLILESLKT